MQCRWHIRNIWPSAARSTQHLVSSGQKCCIFCPQCQLVSYSLVSLLAWTNCERVSHPSQALMSFSPSCVEAEVGACQDSTFQISVRCYNIDFVLICLLQEILSLYDSLRGIILSYISLIKTSLINHVWIDLRFVTSLRNLSHHWLQFFLDI